MMHTIDVSPSAEPEHPATLDALRACPVGWQEYQRANQHIFPTAESWRWFVRQHRAELTACGAVCFLAGRMFVVAETFNAAIIDIGRRLAAARAA